MHRAIALNALKRKLGRMTRREVAEYFERYLRARTEVYYKTGPAAGKRHKREPLWRIETRNKKYELQRLAKDGDKRSRRNPKDDRHGPGLEPARGVYRFALPIDEQWRLNFANLFSLYREHAAAIEREIEAAKKMARL
jgi:hypothetical protein